MAHLSDTATVQRSLPLARNVSSFLEASLAKHPPSFGYSLPDLQVFTLALNTSVSTFTFSNNFTLSFPQSFL